MFRITQFSKPTPSTPLLLAWALLTILGLAAFATPSLADPLDGPRAAGIVGERFDGYAMVRDTGAATGGHHATVKDINAKRRDFYSSRANSQGAQVDAVARIYAEKIFQKAPPGYWFLRENGSWIQK